MEQVEVPYASQHQHKPLRGRLCEIPLQAPEALRDNHEASFEILERSVSKERDQSFLRIARYATTPSTPAPITSLRVAAARLYLNSARQPISS